MHSSEMPAGAGIAAKNRIIDTVGMRLLGDGLAGVVAIDGPGADCDGFGSAAPMVLKGELAESLGGRGSLMLWFKTDRAYHSGAGVRKFEQPLVDVEGLFSLSFISTSDAVNIFWRWADGVEGVEHWRVLVPEVPGPEWLHVACHWDSEAGLFNVFLNGTATKTTEGTEPWSMGTGQAVAVHVGRFALADVRLSAEVVSKEQIGRVVTAEHLGAIDDELGARARGFMDVEALKGELLYDNALATDEDLAKWRLEGAGIVTFADDWMVMASERPDGPEGHFTYWCDREFPADFVAEWEFQRLVDGLCIVFFAGKGRQGEDLFDPSLQARDGIFMNYVKGDIDCYHISYHALERLTANLRKNHGFYLAANGPVGVLPGDEAIHKLTLLKRGGEIKMALDGRIMIDFHDDGKRYGPVLGEGKIGLRQMQWTKGRYRNFRVYAVGEGEVEIRSR